MSAFAFLDPESSYQLPRQFDYKQYIEAEREFWMLFPDTDGKRVNFCQTGLTAQLYVEAPQDGSELTAGETYFLMPCSDGAMRPIRMRPHRRLSLSEYRMSHLTALKVAGRLHGAAEIMDRVHLQILGPEVANEAGY